MLKPEFLTEAAAAAIASEAKTGVPAGFTVAQAALESAWGAHTPGNNCFGLKAGPSVPPEQRQLLATTEWFTPVERAVWLRAMPGRAAQLRCDATGKPQHNPANGRDLYDCRDWFRSFPDLRACFDWHGSLLASSSSYRTAFANYAAGRDPIRFAQDVAVHYATDPNYAAKLVAVMRSADVAAALTRSLAAA